MYLFKEKENGFALIMVFLTIVVLGILVGAFINSTIFNIRFTSHQENRSKAYYAAQAGINHLKSDLSAFYNNYDQPGTKIISNETIDYNDNTSTYTIELNSINGNTKTFLSEGIFNQSEYSISFDVTKLSGLDDFGVFTTKSLDVGGSANIESGSIYVEMTKEEVQEFEDYLDELNIKTVDEGFVFNFTIDQNSFSAETYDQSYNKINNSFTINANDGDKIYIEEIDLSGNKKLIINGSNNGKEETIDIYVNDGFEISGNAEFEVSQDLNVNLFVKNHFDLNGGGNSESIKAINNSAIITYIHPEIENIKLAGNIDGDLLFYAPETIFELTGSADLNGAIIAESINATGNFTINYDDNLDKFKEIFKEEVSSGSGYSTLWRY
ncbi:hypothetical protein [Halanaerobium congolense]|uniref:DUF7305 domain-containing protein n=1 Tax=Halanaerobium congolense TaxID=54121 RepID=UPI0008856546|nr:hypothetical protein [Halanaerobium congolense]SDG78845.1 hypothetical protein SAMN04515651_10139 [Halanaerobium congolense]